MRVVRCRIFSVRNVRRRGVVHEVEIGIRDCGELIRGHRRGGYVVVKSGRVRYMLVVLLEVVNEGCDSIQVGGGGILAVDEALTAGIYETGSCARRTCERVMQADVEGCTGAAGGEGVAGEELGKIVYGGCGGG